MASAYFNAAAGSNWSDAGSWWTDGTYSTPYGSSPNTGDDCYIDAYIIADGAPHDQGGIYCGTINNYTAFNVALDSNFTFTAFEFHSQCQNTGYLNSGSTINIYFYDTTTNSSGGQIYDNAIFYNSSYNAQDCHGNASFYDTSNNSGTVSQDAYFYNTSYNAGTVMNTAYFNDSSYFGAGSAGTAVFGTQFGTDTAYYNGGSLTTASGANFYGYCYVATSSTFSYDATFYDGSHNDGTVGGSGVFHDGSYNNGPISGSGTFHDSSYNGAAISGDGTFYDSSYNNVAGTFSGTPTFWNNSNNQGVVTSAYFRDSSQNNGNVSFGFFYNSSQNAGMGSLNDGDFYDTAANNGICTSICEFHNAGTAQGGYTLSFGLQPNLVASTDGTVGTDGMGSYSAKFTVVKAALDILASGLL